jgi:hypothetical protein
MTSSVDPNWQAIWAHLQQNRCSGKSFQPKARPGIYAVFLSGTKTVADLPVASSGLLYLGMTESDLEVRNHSLHKHSGFSTLRRSLGAVLKQELGLAAEPRAPGASPTNIRCYRFSPASEERLTKWMETYLECAFAVVEHRIRVHEGQLIKELSPPLNLNGWPNPSRPRLRSLRKVCREEAGQARAV